MGNQRSSEKGFKSIDKWHVSSVSFNCNTKLALVFISDVLTENDQIGFQDLIGDFRLFVGKFNIFVEKFVTRGAGYEV